MIFKNLKKLETWKGYCGYHALSNSTIPLSSIQFMHYSTLLVN